MSASRERISFEGVRGQTLAGVLEFPVDQKPHTFAVFIHCFTCGKNMSAARHITRAFTQSGIAVLRFDFTGLGDSDGDFSDTNFKSNLHDVEQAVAYLSKHYQAPRLLGGHSLGGAAALASAFNLDTIEAIVTIGAPSDPFHVTHLLQNEMDTILQEGHGEVLIGQRTFTIKKGFIEDLKQHEILSRLKKLKKPLLILHSPQDEVVNISNAAEIYQAAFHPKSFVTLDGSDHLLSEQQDARYAGEVIGTWVRKYLPAPESPSIKTDHQVAAMLLREDRFTTHVKVGKHQITADEPEEVGGTDFGPSPYELLSSALATCTAMTIKMYADRKSWQVDECIVHVNHEKKHGDDSQVSEKGGSKIDHFTRNIELSGALDETQRKRLLEIANKCPVHRTLESGEMKIETSLKE